MKDDKKSNATYDVPTPPPTTKKDLNHHAPSKKRKKMNSIEHEKTLSKKIKDNTTNIMVSKGSQTINKCFPKHIKVSNESLPIMDVHQQHISSLQGKNMLAQTGKCLKTNIETSHVKKTHTRSNRNNMTNELDNNESKFKLSSRCLLED